MAWALSGCFLSGYDELSSSDKTADVIGQDGASFAPPDDAGANAPEPPQRDSDAHVPDAGPAEPYPPDDALEGGFEGLLPGASGTDTFTECPALFSDCEPVCTEGRGRCVVECSEATRCAPECQPDARCSVACSGVNTCDLVCAEGSRCALDCSHTNHDRTSSCDVSCEAGARCAVDCHENNRCAVTCEEGAACAVLCEKSNNCRDVVCAAGAACLLYCPESDCSEAACLGDGKTCIDGTIACGVDCPLPGAWDWYEFSLALGSHQLEAP